MNEFQDLQQPPTKIFSCPFFRAFLSGHFVASFSPSKPLSFFLIVLRISGHPPTFAPFHFFLSRMNEHLGGADLWSDGPLFWARAIKLAKTLTTTRQRWGKFRNGTNKLRNSLGAQTFPRIPAFHIFGYLKILWRAKIVDMAPLMRRNLRVCPNEQFWLLKFKIDGPPLNLGTKKDKKY